MNTTTPSKLEKIIAPAPGGHVECGPPRDGRPGVVEHKANLIRNHVDAINVTDNQTAVVRHAAWQPVSGSSSWVSNRCSRWSPATATVSLFKATFWGRRPSAFTTCCV